jgi:hypothetical protein
MVDDNAAGEDHGPILLGNGDRQLVPMKQVGADGMAPAHVAPLISEGIVLKEEMVLALEVDEAIRVVRPVCGGREVYLRAIRLVVRLGLRSSWQSTESERNCAIDYSSK